MMIYTDFENFKYFNYKYGYTLGDQVLKDFCSFIIGKTEEKHNLYFTRVVSDQFLMFRTASHEKDEYQGIIEEIEKVNEEFMLRQKEKFPQSNVVLRTGADIDQCIKFSCIGSTDDQHLYKYFEEIQC